MRTIWLVGLLFLWVGAALGQTSIPYRKLQTPSGSVQVPLCLSGTITAVPPLSFCMDAATHLINELDFIPGVWRLAAANDTAKKALEEFKDKPTLVTACGYVSGSPECRLLGVFWVGPAAEIEKNLSKPR